MKRVAEGSSLSLRAPSRRMWRRILAVAAAVGMLMAAIIVRLSVVQVREHTVWQTRAREQQLSDSVISPKRGRIFDAKGTVLAQTVEVATAIMMPERLENDARRAQVADELSVLLGVDRDRLYRRTRKVHSRYEVIKPKMDTALCRRFIDWVQEHRLTAAFRVIQDYKRQYPLKSVLSCVLGFTGSDNGGLEGLEARYDTVLKGRAGRIVTAHNGVGDALPTALQYETTLDGQEGDSLTLTIDATIQQIAEKYLDIAVRETGAANRGSVTVMDVKTGAVLAMATKKDYDPNDPRVLTDAGELAQIATLSGNEQAAARLTALQRFWKNKPISEYYEPGSVFKVFTASSAMQEGLVDEKSHFSCSGTFSMPGVRSMKCHVFPRSHGDQAFGEAISHSCNPAFMTIGLRLGKALFPRYHQAFGFTAVTGIDMLGEARVTPTLYHAAKSITEVDVATSSIGQTFKVTPIQMITGLCAVANGGHLMTPYVVQRVTAPDGTVVKETKPTVRRRVISADVSARICRLLEGVVDGGGAKNAYIPGFHVAGKTGTSEKTDQALSGGRKKVVASFGGMAPATHPRVAVLVMIDEPQTAIRYGGTLAAPVAQRILSEVLPYLGETPEYSEKEQKDFRATVPAVTGKPVAAAKEALQKEGLCARVSGTGNTVTAQCPAAGQNMAKDGTVVLYTGGAPSQTVTVPDVTKKALSAANAALVNAELNLSVQGWRDPAGIAEQVAEVVRQSPDAGTAVARGTVVRVDILYRDATE